MTKQYDINYLGEYKCSNCGYISLNELDMETEYIGLRCKCGCTVIRVPHRI